MEEEGERTEKRSKTCDGTSAKKQGDVDNPANKRWGERKVRLWVTYENNKL